MGRVERRREAKREGRNVKEVQEIIKEHNELKPRSFAMIIGFLVLFFVVLYLITGLFITKDLKWFDKKKTSDNDNNSTYVNNKILAVNSLNQKEEEYYVYYYDSSKEDSDVGSIMDSMETEVYRVDLSDAFNSNYIGEVSGVVDDVSDLKVTDPTVIKVVSSNITEFYGGVEDIKNNLQ